MHLTMYIEMLLPKKSKDAYNYLCTKTLMCIYNITYKLWDDILQTTTITKTAYLVAIWIIHKRHLSPKVPGVLACETST